MRRPVERAAPADRSTVARKVPLRRGKVRRLSVLGALLVCALGIPPAAMPGVVLNERIPVAFSLGDCFDEVIEVEGLLHVLIVQDENENTLHVIHANEALTGVGTSGARYLATLVSTSSFSNVNDVPYVTEEGHFNVVRLGPDGGREDRLAQVTLRSTVTDEGQVIFFVENSWEKCV
jgi:hypothetical protein